MRDETMVHGGEDSPLTSLGGSDFRRALAHPFRVWKGLQHWALLAQYAGLSYADVVHFRRELRDNRELQSALANGQATAGYAFPEAAELYVMVRATRPRVVVETGVSSGFSTAHILAALAANNFGVLHSIDQPNAQAGSMLPPGRGPGWIIPHANRGRWVLHFGNAREVLPPILTALHRVDLFLHDSDHSYDHMTFEYEQALRKLAAGGLLLSDDTHLHAAWDDFCRQHGLRSTRIGHLGVTRKPRAQ